MLRRRRGREKTILITAIVSVVVAIGLILLLVFGVFGIDSVDDTSSQDGSGALVHLRWRVAMGDN